MKPTCSTLRSISALELQTSCSLCMCFVVCHLVTNGRVSSACTRTVDSRLQVLWRDRSLISLQLHSSASASTSDTGPCSRSQLHTACYGSRFGLHACKLPGRKQSPSMGRKLSKNTVTSLLECNSSPASPSHTPVAEQLRLLGASLVLLAAPCSAAQLSPVSKLKFVLESVHNVVQKLCMLCVVHLVTSQPMLLYTKMRRPCEKAAISYQGHYLQHPCLMQASVTPAAESRPSPTHTCPIFIVAELPKASFSDQNDPVNPFTLFGNTR